MNRMLLATAVTGLVAASTANDTGQGITFTAHIDTASSQAITGADRVFFIRVEDNRLVMKSPGLVVPMTGLTRPVEIELVHAD